MMIHIKLKSSEDLVGHLIDETAEWIEIQNPVCFDVDPDHGVFAKSWMMYSKSNTVKLYKTDIYYIANANREAIKYYNQFHNRETKQHTTSTITTSDVENLYAAMLESKISTKH